GRGDHCQHNRLRGGGIRLMSTTSIPENVLTMLQAEWDETASGVTIANIEWLSKRDDAALWQGPGLGTKTYMVACYSPSPSMQMKVLSIHWWMVDEAVTVDIAIKVTSENKVAMRVLLTKMETEIQNLVHKHQKEIEGVQFATVTRENTRVEGKSLLRAAFNVNCRLFHSASAGDPLPCAIGEVS
ncbi:hypothetical protein MUP79_09310, partial [Candidatus Bathyarchaeota archaeon]|nr:hypothetical protein [Candidatus Bathyarchaeota archaeon]